MDAKRFDELSAAGLLPSPTGVVLELLRLTQHGPPTIEEVARVIQVDPVLSGRVLKFANESQFGRLRPVVSIPDAVERLGIESVRDLTKNLLVAGRSNNVPCSEFDYDGFWSRSLAVGIAAELLSSRTRVLPAEEGFSAGLLSQVGRLALASIHPDEYGRILATCPDGCVDELIEHERCAFSTNHNELTAALLREWGFPQVITSPILHHERPWHSDFEMGSRRQTICLVLHASARIGAFCVDTQDRQQPQVRELIEEGGQIGVDPQTMLAICDCVVERWHSQGHVLNLDVPVESSIPRSFADILHSEAPTSADDEPVCDPTRESIQVLVAEEDEATYNLVHDTLTEEGQTVLRAPDGPGTLRLVIEQNPQLVILSANALQTGDLNLCRALRQTVFGRGIYVIAIVDQNDQDTALELFDAGADACLERPLRPDMLLAQVRAGMRWTRLQEQVVRGRERVRQVTSELSVVNRTLQRAALTDTLTGLPNRRHMLSQLSRVWASAVRTERPLSCLLLDIDHFKQLNDEHGHDFGDLVLKRVAAVLGDSVRSDEFVCRYGGEEFVVICPDGNLEAAQQCAERLRSAIEAKISQSFPRLDGPVTVSVGVATSDVAQHPGALLKAADEALYTAKHAGRNRVATATEMSSSSTEPRAQGEMFGQPAFGAILP